MPLLFERPDRPLDLTGKIRRLDEYACEGGSFGDIYKGLYDGPSGTIEVAVKALRFSMMSREDIEKSEYGILSEPLHRELGIWRRLSQKNIVPFLGIASGFGPYISLVSTWMPNGTLQDFMRREDERLSIVDRFCLLNDIVSGLDYLHDCSVVHGDLTACNVLIDEYYRASLTDFGFSTVIGGLPDGLAYLRRSTRSPGAIRWAAPEKVLQDLNTMTPLTSKSDIYSFGCIMLQVLSGKQPWVETSDSMIPVYMSRGQSPQRPSSRPIDDQYWALIQECWASVGDRPSSKQVAAAITSVLSSLRPPSMADSPCGNTAEQSGISPLLDVSEGVRRHSSSRASKTKRRKNQSVRFGKQAVVGLVPTHRIRYKLRLQKSSDDDNAMSTQVGSSSLPSIPASPSHTALTHFPVSSSGKQQHPSHTDASALWPIAQPDLDIDFPLEMDEYPGVLLPAMPYSIYDANSWTWPSDHLARPRTSDFSRLYNINLPDDDNFLNDVSSQYLLMPGFGLDRSQNALLTYYMDHILPRQFPAVDHSLALQIWELIHVSDAAHDVACLLSDLHQKGALSNSLLPPILDVQLRRLQMLSIESAKDEDALGTLFAVSCITFFGRREEWQHFLDGVCGQWVLMLNNADFGGPRRFLLRCSDNIRFLIKIVMWYDIISAITLIRTPRFLDVIRDIFGNGVTQIDGASEGPIQEYSMMSFVGCDDHVMLVLAETACLASWKESSYHSGSLRVPELVKRGQAIEEILKRSDFIEPMSKSLQSRFPHLVSEIFRTSARVYLHSVISGSYPRCPEILEGVTETIRYLKAARDVQNDRSIARSAVFCTCICGCLTENPEYRRYLLKTLQELKNELLGGVSRVELLINDIWKRKREGPVDWRQVMREAEPLLA